MHKKYDARKVKSYRSYKIADLCRIHHDDNLHKQTIRTWIKQGKLQAMMHEGDYYIYGAIWKNHIKQNNNGNKRTLAFREMSCRKCKFIGEPLDGQILELKLLPSGGLEAQVVCRSCRHQNRRLYKRVEHQKIHNEFVVLHDLVEQLKDSDICPRKTHIVNAAIAPASESPILPAPAPPENSHTSLNKANSTHDQTNFFDLL
jgi:hypothetical protein